MTEKTIRQNQQLYVLGEAFLSGDEIHIGAPGDRKKPFIVTTKSEDDMVRSTEQNATLALIGGIASVAIGVLIIFLFASCSARCVRRIFVREMGLIPTA